MPSPLSRRQLLTAAMSTALCASAALASGQAAASKAAPRTLWIDVRTPAEYASGHLPGAINIPLDVIEQRIAQHAPDKHAPIALYCRSGRRSGLARDILLKMGYTRVSNEGGYADLVRRGVKPQ